MHYGEPFSIFTSLQLFSGVCIVSDSSTKAPQNLRDFPASYKSAPRFLQGENCVVSGVIHTNFVMQTHFDFVSSGEL